MTRFLIACDAVWPVRLLTLYSTRYSRREPPTVKAAGKGSRGANGAAIIGHGGTRNWPVAAVENPDKDNSSGSGTVKALARAFWWRKMMDEGVYSTIEDLVRAKGVAPSYVSWVLRLTMLAPEIVEAILDGRQPADIGLDDFLEGLPMEWGRQGEQLRALTSH